jgi:hypothetical protein
MNNKSKKVNKKQPRFTFKKDDDGHNYLIPLADVKKFGDLISIGCDTDNFNEFEEAFGDTRCDHPSLYSFTDPKRET